MKKNAEVINEILNRLNENSNGIYLYDVSDQSTIVIDEELKTIVRRYYESKLYNLKDV